MPFFASTAVQIFRLGRFRFLFLGLALYLLGALTAVYSGVELHLDRLAAGYLILVTGHLSMHYSNDYFDYEADLKARPNTLSGGSGVLREHPQLKAVALGMALALGLGSVGLGALFAWHYAYSPGYVGLVIFANLLGWYYAAPPVRLSYRGLGEIATVLGVGLIMPLAGSLALGGPVTPAFIAFAPAVLLYSLSFILSVEQPDMEADVAAGKRTFVARHGRKAGFAAMAAANLAATGYFLLLFLTVPGSLYLAALALSLLPLAIGLGGLALRPSGRVAALQIAMVSVSGFALFLVAMDALLVYYVL